MTPMSTTSELVERLQNVSEWKQIIERHRRITDDPRISYVLQDGTRVHEDESVVAKLAASLSRALEDAADTASAAAARLDELERENARMREALTAMLAENGALHVNSINSDSPAEKQARLALQALAEGGGE
jgi:hypothetical protein